MGHILAAIVAASFAVVRWVALTNGPPRDYDGDRYA